MTDIPEGQTRKEDHLDVGVLKLEDIGLPPYPEVEKYPLPIDDLLPNAQPREGKTYLIVGYPSSKSGVHHVRLAMESQRYGFFNVSHPIDKYSEFGLTPESHIAIVFDIKKSFGPGGKRRSFPDPHGISGSPVWLLYDDREDQNNPEKIRVAGIAIEHRRKQHVIVATEIDLVRQMILSGHYTR